MYIEASRFLMSGWLYILLIVLVVYLAISIVLYFLQDYLMFKPEKLPADFQFYYENQETEEYNVETRDGATLNGLRFKAKNPKRAARSHSYPGSGSPSRRALCCR